MKKPIVMEKFTNTGEHSHWELVNAQTGETLWEEGRERGTPRYITDIRIGCGAVIDTWHKDYDKDYQGISSDNDYVVLYRSGYYSNNEWNIKDEDVEWLNNQCKTLNEKV